MLLLHGAVLGSTVVSLFDAKTSSRVVLVGTQHFNPASIELADRVVREEAAGGRLRCVALESCETRWNATLEQAPAGSMLRSVLDNEMQAAAEAGTCFGAHTALVDQRIEDTIDRMGQLLMLTLTDLATPWSGGWSRISDDIRQASAQVLGSGGLGAFALDPALVLGGPLSLFRYVYSAWVTSPLLLRAAFVASVAFYYGADLILPDPEATAPASSPLLVDVRAFLAFQAFQWIVYARVLLVGLLEERNYVIARNIRRACLSEPGGTVVAVIGLLHMNGCAQLLNDTRIV